MPMSKEQLRRVHGLREPEALADPNVLTRSKYHEAAAKWLAKWSYPLQVAFALIGFVIVLLPMFSKNWLAVIENTPVAGRIFHDFSTLSGWAMVLLFVLMVLWGILNWLVKNYPGGWHPTKQWGFPNPKQVVELELYPRLKREEFVFWVDIIFGATGTTLWMIFFGVLAFFIRIGG